MQAQHLTTLPADKSSLFSDIHPIHPWIAIAESPDQIVLFDWKQNQILRRFSLGQRDAQQYQLSRAIRAAEEACILPFYQPSQASGRTPTSAPSDRPDKHPAIFSVRFMDTAVAQWWWWGSGHQITCRSFASRSLPRKPQWIVAVTDAYVAFVDYEADVIEYARNGRDFDSKASVVEMFPASPMLAIGCADGCIRLWDTRIWRVALVCKGGHKSAIDVLLSFQQGKESRLISGASDGSVCIWNPSSGGVLHQFKSPHEGPVIAALAYRRHPLDSMVLTVGADKSVFEWSKVESDATMLSKRIARAGKTAFVFHSRYERGSMIVADQAKVYHGDQLLYEVSKKKIRINHMATSPLHPSIVALSTSVGTIVLDLGHSLPNAAMSNATLFYLNDGHVLYRSIEGGEAKELGGGVDADIGVSGSCVSVLHRQERRWEVFYKGQLAGSGLGKALVWSDQTDMFAVLDQIIDVPTFQSRPTRSRTSSFFGGKRPDDIAPVPITWKVVIWKIQQGKAVIVVPTAEAPVTVKSIVGGGPLLGVCTSDDELLWLAWKSGKRLSIPPVPLPNRVRWDRAGRKVALLYDDNAVVVEMRPSPRVLDQLPFAICDALWFCDSLFFDTGRSIHVAFPSLSLHANESIRSLLLASVDLPVLGMRVLPQSDVIVDDDGIQAPCVGRPGGSLSLLGVIDDQLIVSGDGGVTHSISLASPALRIFLLAQAGRPKDAVRWVESTSSHDDIARFLAARGYVAEALKLSKLSLWEEAHLHLLNSSYEKGVVCIEKLLVTSVPSDKPHQLSLHCPQPEPFTAEDAVWFFLTSAEQAALKDDAVGRRAVLPLLERAAKLDESLYVMLCLTLLSRGMKTELQKLYERLKATGKSEPSWIAAMMLADDALMIDSLKKLERFSEVCVLARNTVSDSQEEHVKRMEEVVGAWNASLVEKLPSLPLITLSARDGLMGRRPFGARMRSVTVDSAANQLNVPGGRVGRRVRQTRTGGGSVSINALAPPPSRRMSKEAPS